MINNYDYETDYVSDTIAAVLFSTHAISHQPGATAPSAKVERVKRPVISSAGTSEDWNYFLSRWNDYVEATKVTGKDEVLQLLECCDEELRRDVTRMAGGSLTNKTAEEALAAIRTLSVREESPMVARAALYAMHQTGMSRYGHSPLAPEVRPGLASSFGIVRSAAQLWISLTP